MRKINRAVKIRIYPNKEQISYNGYLGKEKPKNYVIYLDGEEISIDWNESDIMIV